MIENMNRPIRFLKGQLWIRPQFDCYAPFSQLYSGAVIVMRRKSQAR